MTSSQAEVRNVVAELIRTMVVGTNSLAGTNAAMNDEINNIKDKYKPSIESDEARVSAALSELAEVLSNDWRTHSRGQVGLVHVRKPAVSTQHRKKPARFRTGFRLGEDARQRGSQSAPSLLSSSPKLESPSPFGEMRLQRGLHHVRLFIFSHENCL